MTYREIKAFSEHMRSLGYPHLISLEAFRTPNFDLVADLLRWLVKSYDPHAKLHTTTLHQESDRVEFIKSVAQFLATRAQLKLNPKKLYMADHHAVQELFKLSDLFVQAQKQLDIPTSVRHSPSSQQASSPPLPPASSSTSPLLPSSLLDSNSSANLPMLKATKEFTSELTSKGAHVYDLLLQELDHR
ncbi:Clusterin-associated protein 1, partial [Coelomomyces lativittatus]